MTEEDNKSKKQREKRGIQPEVPFGYEALLTDPQRMRIDACRRFGWELHFIRRPLFLEPTIVMIDAKNTKTWQVTDEGELVPFDNLRTD